MVAGRDARPRRLLVISFHFTPDGSVGGFRWAGLSKYLARNGWVVDVITAAPQDGAATNPGVRVHHVPRRRTFNDWYNDWRAARASPPSAGAAPAATPAKVPDSEHADVSNRGLLASIRGTLGAALAFPDHSRGWVLSAAGVARRLLQQEPFDVVVTSGPPHFAHVAGSLATAGTGVPHWMDLRDPWQPPVDRDWGPQWIETAGGLRHLIPWLERRVFHRADRIITNTAGFAEVVRRRYPRMPVSYVPNGIDLERIPAPATQKFEGLSIAYAGTLYFNRNLSPVVQALRDFLQRHPEARSAVRLRIAGSMESAHEAQFRRDIHEAGLTEVVEFLGRIPSAQALDLINRSHLSLVLAQGQELQVPAKLYECVALGVPTLVITESGSASAVEAERIGGWPREATDVAGIRALIEQLWANPRPAPAPVNTFDYKAVAADMDALLRTAGT